MIKSYDEIVREATGYTNDRASFTIPKGIIDLLTSKDEDEKENVRAGLLPPCKNVSLDTSLRPIRSSRV